MKFLSSIFKSKPVPKFEPFTAELRPDKSIFVVGDVHGRADLLLPLLAKKPSDSQLVFVGDLVDRGDQSAEVLTIVKDLCQTGAICLMGNHERMMLDFINQPTELGARWMRYGGLQTLQSYDVRGISERAGNEELLAARDALLAEMPDGMEDWITKLPLQWATGNVHVVHAAAKPEVAMSEQRAKNLLWGASDFFQRPRTDGQWIVHGHTIFDQPTIEDGRISIDTGAFATGKLTALQLDSSGHCFVTNSSF